MDQFCNKIKELLGLKGTMDAQEIDLGGACPLSQYVKKDFLRHMDKSIHKIDAHLKIKKNLDGKYVFEGAIVYHEKNRDKVLYLNQILSKEHIHGGLAAKLSPEEDFSFDVHADSYSDLASKTEKYAISEHPEHSENGYTKGVYQLINKLGFHARAAAAFVDEASKYQSDVYLRVAERPRENGGISGGDLEINGKNYIDGASVISCLTLAAEKGSKLEILTKGEDEKQALEGLGNIILSRFGESE